MQEAEAESGKADEVVRLKKLLDRIDNLHEQNPMLGHRGCRLGITYPEITEMQVKAIFMAAAELIRDGKRVFPEIMIPLVGQSHRIGAIRRKSSRAWPSR